MVREAGKHIGKYGPIARAVRLELHRAKRRRRDFNQIRYACRKTICHKRVRVKGRFLKRLEGEKPTCAYEKEAPAKEPSLSKKCTKMIKEKRKFQPKGPPSPTDIADAVFEEL